VRTDWAGSGCPADVAMMQATDFGNRDDRAEFRPLNWPAMGCILVEREVSSVSHVPSWLPRPFLSGER
jgi:hypothetical protein